MLITLEGVDGVGKSRVCELLAQKYPYAIMTKEPQSKDMVELYGDNDYCRMYAFLLDHSLHTEQVLKKKVIDNLIICDRYIDSRCAYQSVELHVPMSRIRNMHCPEYSIEPDVTFILVAKLDEIAARLLEREGIQSCASDMRKLGDIQNRYMQIANEFPRRCMVIDTTCMTAEEVADKIELTLESSFSKKMSYIRSLDNHKKVIVHSITS